MDNGMEARRFLTTKEEITGLLNLLYWNYPKSVHPQDRMDWLKKVKWMMQ